MYPPVPDDRTNKLETSVRRTGWPCPADRQESRPEPPGMIATTTGSAWRAGREHGLVDVHTPGRERRARSRLRRAGQRRPATTRPGGPNVRVWAILFGGSRSGGGQRNRQATGRWRVARLRRQRGGGRRDAAGFAHRGLRPSPAPSLVLHLPARTLLSLPC
jgi:hypothetical protein